MNQRITVTERRPSKWGGILVGLLMALSGIALLAWPFFSGSTLLAAFVGIALIASGISSCVRGSGLSIAWGIVVILLGVIAFAFPEFTANALVSFGGLLMLLIGIGVCAIGGRLGAAALVPGILLVIGGIVSFIFPAIALTLVTIVFGVALVVAGVFVVVRAGGARGPRAGDTTIIVD